MATRWTRRIASAAVTVAMASLWLGCQTRTYEVHRRQQPPAFEHHGEVHQWEIPEEEPPAPQQPPPQQQPPQEEPRFPQQEEEPGGQGEAPLPWGAQ